MEVVHQCPHYQRNCKSFNIKVMSRLLVVEYSIRVNCVMMRNMSLRRDVRSIEWNLKRSKESNV